MKTTKFYVLVLILATSCSLKEVEENTNLKVENEYQTITTPTYSSRETRVESATGNFGKYANLFAGHDATIAITSHRNNPMETETIMAYYDPVNVTGTKSIGNTVQPENIIINGKALFQPNTKSSGGNIREMFGNRVSFGLSGCSPLSKSSNEEDVTLYAPEMIGIDFPEISEENHFPLCYYKNFVVRWNKDEKNENGVIILVKWNGTMVFGEDYSSSYICRSVCVPDNGEAELNEDIFDGIPDTSLCRLYVFRGDVENMDIEEATYQVLAEVHDVINFVLIRNLESI